MKLLDDIKKIKKLDKVNVLGSIEELGLQCNQAWNDIEQINIPDNYRKINKIVFSAMGGSALGAYVTKSLFLDSLMVPFEIINDYHLPPYIDESTLVILSSYSGTTEETISCAKDALEKRAKIIGMTTGGKLAEILKEKKLPSYIFEPKFNPSNQPRLGMGYSIFGQIALFNKLGLIKINKNEKELLEKAINKGNKLYGIESVYSDNLAKKLAIKWTNKIPIIITAEFLTNVGRVLRNQINENSKSYAAFHEIPELNHHLMEGLKYPENNKKTLTILLLESQFYSQKIKTRLKITEEVIKKNGISSDNIFLTSNSKISQVFEAIQLGSYINFYLAVSYNIDPSKIPWVDYFKDQLKKIS